MDGAAAAALLQHLLSGGALNSPLAAPGAFGLPQHSTAALHNQHQWMMHTLGMGMAPPNLPGGLVGGGSIPHLLAMLSGQQLPQQPHQHPPATSSTGLPNLRASLAPLAPSSHQSPTGPAASHLSLGHMPLLLAGGSEPSAHQQSAQPQSPGFACQQCSQCFQTSEQLNAHARVHARHKKRFQCRHCEKRFAKKCNLDRHERLHTGVKPLRCPVCSRTFSDDSNALRHVRAHNVPNAKLLRPVRNTVSAEARIAAHPTSPSALAVRQPSPSNSSTAPNSPVGQHGNKQMMPALHNDEARDSSSGIAPPGPLPTHIAANGEFSAKGVIVSSADRKAPQQPAAAVLVTGSFPPVTTAAQALLLRRHACSPPTSPSIVPAEAPAITATPAAGTPKRLSALVEAVQQMQCAENLAA